MIGRQKLWEEAMTSRSKAWLAVGAVLVVLALGLLAIVFGTRYATRHVPGNTLLLVEISGPVPELTPDSPFGEIFGPRLVSRQDLRDGLVQALSDPRVQKVVVKVGDLQAGFATIQEIHALLEKVRKAGKETYAYLDTAGEFSPGNAQYFVASACKTVVLNPLGDINLTGLAVRSPFIRGTLDKLEIEPDFPGIGDYKTARFLYTQKDFTPAHKEMMQWLLDSVTRQMVAGIASGRGMDPKQVEQLVRGGPYIGPEALRVKLVDELNDWESFLEENTTHPDRNLERISLRRYLRAGRPDRSGIEIAVVVAEGTILRGESGYSPMPVFGGDVMGADTIARAFRQVRDSGAKAIIFRINSPGGSAVASEIIRAEMARTAKKIPVVVSMGDVAASGGYWITCGAKRIVADPGSITASIGVFGGHLAMSRFWEDKLGITWGKLDGAPNAAIYGSLDPWTLEQQAAVQKFLDRIYDRFLKNVSASRNMPREVVDAIGRGRVFTGEQAKERGLVDALGGFDAALAAARELAGLKPDGAVELTFYPKAQPVWQRLLERSDDADARMQATLREVLAGRAITPGPVWLAPIKIQ
jgi:protease IV